MKHLYLYVCGLLACMSLALPASAQRYTIASISATAVSELSEFEDGKCYLINHNGQGYLYEAEHDKCEMNGPDADKSHGRNRVKRGDNTAPAVGSVPTGKVFFVKVVTDGRGHKSYAFVGTEGTYIDNRTHNATSPGDPMHMVPSDTAVTFTLTKQTDDNNPQYWKMESTQTSGKTIVDYGGTDGGGMVLVNSAAAPKIAFYEVTLVRDYMVRSVEDFKADKTYMIANVTHGTCGYLYANESAGHSCSVGQPRIQNQPNAAQVSADDHNFLFKVEAVTVGNEKQYAFKHVATNKYIDNVDHDASTPGDPVHLSATQSPFKLAYDSGNGLWQITIPEKSTNNDKDRSALTMGGADGGGLVIWGNNLSEFAIYEVPEARITLNSADGIDDINYIGTFSAPYEAVLPEGVKAWYVSNTNNTQAVMVQAEGGQSIPANTGVILTAETAVNVIPVYDYKNNVTPVSIPANNLLHHTAAATHTAVDGDLVLGKSGNVVAFYGARPETTFALYKAYLHLNGASTTSLALRFTDETTGIGQIGMETDAAKGAIYDLSGRRIAAPVKGQLYIQNGKKHIAQ